MWGWPALKDRSGHRVVEGPLRRVTVVLPGQGIRKDVLVPGQVAGHKKDVVLPAPCPDVQCQAAQRRGLGPTLLVVVLSEITSTAVPCN